MDMFPRLRCFIMVAVPEPDEHRPKRIKVRIPRDNRRYSRLQAKSMACGKWAK